MKNQDLKIRFICAVLSVLAFCSSIFWAFYYGNGNNEIIALNVIGIVLSIVLMIIELVNSYDSDVKNTNGPYTFLFLLFLKKESNNEELKKVKTKRTLWKLIRIPFFIGFFFDL